MIYGFFWLVEHEIAGMSLPNGLAAASARHHEDLTQECQDEIRELQLRGIGAIVSLTERGLNPTLIKQLGFKYLHLPVPDMTSPTIEQVREFLNFVKTCRKEKYAVVVHCLAGIGRTGTFLACYLVSRGHDSESAIRAVRLCRPGAVETGGQLDFIERFEMEIKKNRDNTDA